MDWLLVFTQYKTIQKSMETCLLSAQNIKDKQINANFCSIDGSRTSSEYLEGPDDSPKMQA